MALNPVRFTDVGVAGETVATWPVGGDAWNRDYTREQLASSGATQVYVDPGWIDDFQTTVPADGFGMMGEEVSKAGNKRLIIDEELPYESAADMIFTGPDIYSQDLAELSGASVTVETPANVPGVLVDEADGYVLRPAGSETAEENPVVAYGYPSAFAEESFPVITVENARDAYMALAYDEQVQKMLEETWDRAYNIYQKKEDERLQELKETIGWSEPDGSFSAEWLGVHQAIAEAYLEVEGEYPEREGACLINLESLAEREDEVGRMARRYQEFNEWQEGKLREILLADVDLRQEVASYWERNVIGPSARLRDVANRHGEQYTGFLDLHDFFNQDVGPETHFDRPRMDGRELLDVLTDVAEESFDSVQVVGLPWEEEEDGMDRFVPLLPEIADELPTLPNLGYERPDICKPSWKDTSPYRPVMILSDQPVNLADEAVHLSPYTE